MQIKDNITATSNPKIANLKSPIKMVKLRSKDVVSKNSDKIMESIWNLANKEIEEQVETPKTTEQEVPVTETPEVKTENNKTVSEPPKEIKQEEPVQLPLTSEEVIRSKKNILGIEAYKDIESTNINLETYQNARRLRVNEVVIGNANRERNINGIERIKQKEELKTQETVKNISSLNEFEGMKNTEKETYQEPEYNNNSKLDEWLNKETAPVKSENDSFLDEVNELQSKLNDNTSSLATQREILEALRARIASNEELCRARKKELEEENMNVTRELNDVLAEINQLTNLANEQEAFLGISNDDESLGKSRVA